jgi:hypothetical protein
MSGGCSSCGNRASSCVSSLGVDLLEGSRPTLRRALRAALFVGADDGFPLVATITLAVVASQDGGWLFAVGAFLHGSGIIAFRVSVILRFRLFSEDFAQ